MDHLVTTGGSATKFQIQPLVFTKAIDSASPTFFRMLASGTAFATVDLVIRQSGFSGTNLAPYCASALSLVALQSIQWTNDAASDTPIEMVTIQYGQIDWSYTTFDSSGNPTTTLTVNWDQVQNTGTGVSQTSVTPPSLVYPATQAAVVGASLQISPTVGPLPAAAIDHLAVKSLGGYNGAIAVDQALGTVTLTNVQPAGGPYTITIELVDTNWVATDASFALTVVPILAANPDHIDRVFGNTNAVFVPIATLLANDPSTAIFDQLISQTTTLGATVTLQGSNILYQPLIPDPGQDDSFTYRIRDASGQTATGTVTVGMTLPGGRSTGNLSIRLSSQTIALDLTGLPAREYQLQSAQSPTGPWTNVGAPFTADTNGVSHWVDSRSQSETFYRAFHTNAP
jgi:type VI secretion system Hcp family effector